MGFSNQERINLNSKALQAGVLDGNASAVWYETFFPFGFILGSESVFTQMAALRALPAPNLATAQTNASNNPTLLQDKSANANAIRITLVAGTNNTTFAAYSVYNDTTSALLENWLLPQLIPQNTGAPSNGYAVRLFNGDPNAGGTEITTTDGTTGTGVNKSVGWVWNYARGLLLLSGDFYTETGINSGTFNPYVLGFRYIGTTAGSGSTGGFDYADLLSVADAQTVFTLTAAPDPNRAKHQIVKNGRIMTLGVGYDYTLSGTTLTFNYGLRADDILVAYFVT